MFTITPGSRTLIAALFAMSSLLAGFSLLEANQRGAAYGAFSLAVVGVVGAIATKASVDALSSGDGVKGAKANLMTAKKPGEELPPDPPQAPQPPVAP